MTVFNVSLLCVQQGDGKLKSEKQVTILISTDPCENLNDLNYICLIYLPEVGYYRTKFYKACDSVSRC